MPLSDDERQQLEALMAKDQEPDPDDYDIEIWDETGAGAKVPYRKGKTWLQRFGIDLPEQPPKPDKTDKPEAKPEPTTTQKYFGPRSTKAS